MIETAIGTMKFDMGFKKQDVLLFCGKEKNIVVKAKAYYEQDGITDAQKAAIDKYKQEKSKISNDITDLIEKSYRNDKERFVPKTILVGREGELALLCSDNKNPDEGIAICVYPKLEIVSQDDYL